MIGQSTVILGVLLPRGRSLPCQRAYRTGKFLADARRGPSVAAPSPGPTCSYPPRESDVCRPRDGCPRSYT